MAKLCKIEIKKRLIYSNKYIFYRNTWRYWSWHIMHTFSWRWPCTWHVACRSLVGQLIWLSWLVVHSTLALVVEKREPFLSCLNQQDISWKIQKSRIHMLCKEIISYTSYWDHEPNFTAFEHISVHQKGTDKSHLNSVLISCFQFMTQRFMEAYGTKLACTIILQ